MHIQQKSDSAMTSTTGSCLCGQVRFVIHGELGGIQVCYCSQCRKAQGGPLATNIPVRQAQIEWVAGLDQLRHFLNPRPASCVPFARNAARRFTASAAACRMCCAYAPVCWMSPSKRRWPVISMWLHAQRGGLCQTMVCPGMKKQSHLHQSRPLFDEQNTGLIWLSGHANWIWRR